MCIDSFLIHSFIPLQDKNTVINDMKNTSMLYGHSLFFSVKVLPHQSRCVPYDYGKMGLPQLNSRLYQDSKGFIWMGTLNGLSRYDGNSFVTYRPEGGNKISLMDHRIRDLEEDKNGFLWIATSAELFSCYDLKKDCFVDFTIVGNMNNISR